MEPVVAFKIRMRGFRLADRLSLITEHWDIFIIQYCHYRFFFLTKNASNGQLPLTT